MAQREKDYQFSISSMKAERLKDKAYGNSEAVKTMDSQIKMAEGMQTELINAGKEIKSMKSITDQIFSIKAFKELQNGDAFTTYIQDKKTVLFVFDGQNFGSLLHEFSHGYDFLKGENSFKYTDQSKVNFNDLKSIRSDQRGKEGSFYDVYDEQRASAKAGALDGKTTPSTGEILKVYNADKIYPSTSRKNKGNTTPAKSEIVYKSLKNK